ncbi:844293ff-547d-43d8-8e43-5a00a49b7bf4 [Thermothielavioides terrestris]|uniref:844293ff-547d-43d8-8e43-5a00a49b7bf4 n=1 Tax=Thermothielavioides terrestris TaxID=2587410 RepID=A0A446BL41_9PEZI|nr:844293ff-547d-43d8-8e43-5a00a49b7bf4 [Thermothielavioides terrestris]
MGSGTSMKFVFRYVRTSSGGMETIGSFRASTTQLGTKDWGQRGLAKPQGKVTQFKLAVKNCMSV